MCTAKKALTGRKLITTVGKATPKLRCRAHAAGDHLCHLGYDISDLEVRPGPATRAGHRHSYLSGPARPVEKPCGYAGKQAGPTND